MKVSFDFDGTLQREDVQEYAKKLIDRGVDVWVVTTRFDENHKSKWILHFPDAPWAHEYAAHPDDPNYELWEVCHRLGIPRHKVRFTCMEWKYTYLNGTSFSWHLDDNPEEFSHAKAQGCSVPMIQVNTSVWKNKCERLLPYDENNHELYDYSAE